MGIRFACHSCSKQLNIKRELAGRRGVCPACAVRFRIPLGDAENSTPVESLSRENTPAAPLAPDASRATNTPAAATSAAASDRTAMGGNDGGDLFDDPVASDNGEPSLSVLDEDPNATWYVRPPSGGQYGPASSKVLREWIDEGRVATTALLWRDGWPQWREAGETLPELSARLPVGNVASPIQSPTVGPETTSSSPSPQLAGQASVGSERRSRSMKRVLLIGVLSALAATLIGVLVMVVNR